MAKGTLVTEKRTWTQAFRDVHSTHPIPDPILSDQCPSVQTDRKQFEPTREFARLRKQQSQSWCFEGQRTIGTNTSCRVEGLSFIRSDQT